MKDVINDLKESDTWKIHLTIITNFISSEDNDEERVMHSKNDNTEIIINDTADEVKEERFKSVQNRHQYNLEESVKGSEFVFDRIHLLYYKCHKINFKRAGLYIDSPDWIKTKKQQ